MRVVTIVSLGACALFGLSALVVAKTMMPNPGAAKAAAPQATVGVPIVVAKGALKFGDKLDASKIEVLKVPSNAVPEGAFSTTAQVLAQDGGGPPVVLTQVAAREPLLPAKLSGPGARASVAAEIHDGMRAYTIKVSDVTGVGGHALPGDRVDVVLMRDLSTDQTKHNYISQVVTQDIRVLGVDLNADLSSNKPATPSTATLEVSVADAQKLAVAGDLGKLSLALRKTGSAEIAQTATMRTEALFGAAPRPSSGHATVRRIKVAAAEIPVAAPLITIVADGGSEGKHRSRAPKPAPAAPTPAAPAPITPGTTPNPAAALAAATGAASRPS
jgi:pilus assembly protein CpaB